MIDCLLRRRELVARSALLDQLGQRKNGSGCRRYGVLTLPGPSNLDDPNMLEGIFRAVSALAADLSILFPIHPRTRKSIESFRLMQYLSNADASRGLGIVPLDPLGYLDFLSLNDRARLVLTDSGGIQEETTVLGVPCLTLRENTERPATVEHGSNQIVGVKPDRTFLREHDPFCRTRRGVLSGLPLGRHGGSEDCGDAPRLDWRSRFLIQKGFGSDFVGARSFYMLFLLHLFHYTTFEELESNDEIVCHHAGVQRTRHAPASRRQSAQRCPGH
jgi:hypothetical protein